MPHPPPPPPPPPPSDDVPPPVATAWMVMVSVSVSDPPELLAVSVTEDVPMAVGMPEMRPVAALTLRPAGRPVAAKPVGLLVAVV